MATAFLLLLLLTVLAITEAAAPPPSSHGCTDELMSFSPCLTYVSSPPSNLTETPSTACCNAFSSSTMNSLCFCHLLRDPLILGFPLNTTRLLSLSSVCTSTTNFFCSESPALPPINSTQIGINAAGGGGGGRGGGGGGRGGGGRGGGRGGRGRRNGSSSSMAGGYKSLLLSLMLAIFVTSILASLNSV